VINISRTEQYTAIAVGVGMWFVFYHFHLIPASYMAGRIVSASVVGLGGGMVIIIWPHIFKKKDHSERKNQI
jgi:hypothetical protein